MKNVNVEIGEMKSTADQKKIGRYPKMSSFGAFAHNYYLFVCMCACVLKGVFLIHFIIY